MFLSEYLDVTIKKVKEQVANLVTLVNLCLGGFSIIATLNGEFNLSLLLIFIAAFTDRLDGSIARKLKIESELGKQLDSFSDIISFGIAPALLVYQGILFESGAIGQLLIVLYFACGAIRLAKFNLIVSNGYFSGLPITVAGTILTFTFLFAQSLSLKFYLFTILLLAILMVSPFRIKKV